MSKSFMNMKAIQSAKMVLFSNIYKVLAFLCILIATGKSQPFLYSKLIFSHDTSR